MAVHVPSSSCSIKRLMQHDFWAQALELIKSSSVFIVVSAMLVNAIASALSTRLSRKRDERVFFKYGDEELKVNNLNSEELAKFLVTIREYIGNSSTSERPAEPPPASGPKSGEARL